MAQTMYNHPATLATSHMTTAEDAAAMAQTVHIHPATLATPPMTTADAREIQQAAVDTATATYSAQGAIARWGDHEVAIAHQAIPALRWPPMTMTFALPDALASRPLAKGSAVNFSFRLQDGTYTVSDIQPVQP
ncbi:copper-binding protein [Candidatus Sodalis endolongispinus]|nr:copper-binding protein [Candidatus Sodalis endolongispinus]